MMGFWTTSRRAGSQLNQHPGNPGARRTGALFGTIEESEMAEIRNVHGTYPGAIAWDIYDDRSSGDIAVELCLTGQCDSYWIDGQLHDACGLAMSTDETHQCSVLCVLCNGTGSHDFSGARCWNCNGIGFSS